MLSVDRSRMPSRISNLRLLGRRNKAFRRVFLAFFLRHSRVIFALNRIYSAIPSRRTRGACPTEHIDRGKSCWILLAPGARSAPAPGTLRPRSGSIIPHGIHLRLSGLPAGWAEGTQSRCRFILPCKEASTVTTDQHRLSIGDGVCQLQP